MGDCRGAAGDEGRGGEIVVAVAQGEDGVVAARERGIAVGRDAEGLAARGVGPRAREDAGRAAVARVYPREAVGRGAEATAHLHRRRRAAPRGGRRRPACGRLARSLTAPHDDDARRRRRIAACSSASGAQRDAAESVDAPIRACRPAMPTTRTRRSAATRPATMSWWRDRARRRWARRRRRRRGRCAGTPAALDAYEPGPAEEAEEALAPVAAGSGGEVLLPQVQPGKSASGQERRASAMRRIRRRDHLPHSPGDAIAGRACGRRCAACRRRGRRR